MDTAKPSLHDVMHGLEKEYLRYTIIGPFGFNLLLKISFSSFDRKTIEKVIAAIIHRHESLRTTFTRAGDSIAQVIHPYAPGGFEVRYFDWTGADRQRQQLDQMVKGLSKLPFDFEKGPLIDVRVVHLSPDDHLLIFTLHHVISDEISLEILRNELFLLYEAYMGDMPDPLPPVRMQYKAYAKWVKEHLDSEKGAASRKFYIDRLSASIARAGIRPAAASYRQQLDRELQKYLNKADVADVSGRTLGYLVNIYTHPAASYTVYMRNRYLARLKRLAARHRVTLFSVVLALLSLLLRKVKNDKYQRIYIPFDTRVSEEFFGIVGWLVGNIIVCLDCDTDRSLHEWVPTVERAVLEASDHRFYPYEQIMKELDVTVDVLSPTHINFVRGNGPIRDFTPTHNYSTEAHFYLACTINEYENGLRFMVNYRTDKYAHAEITTMFVLMDQWLEQID